MSTSASKKYSRRNSLKLLMEIRQIGYATNSRKKLRQNICLI